jgi:hypothetical protein
MATYELSTYGRNIVINEGNDGLPPIRIIFIMITILFGLVLRFKEAIVFWSLWLARKRSYIITLLFIAYTCNSVIHTVHYADNIARPVDYYEPKFLYQKYILSTMEITFYANFPISLMGKFLFYFLVIILIAMIFNKSFVLLKNFSKFKFLFLMIIIESLIQ